MKYDYEIYRPGSKSEVAAFFTTSEPVPHIQAGHHLILHCREYQSIPANRLEIADVEVCLVVSDDDQLRLVKTMIYVRVREETPQP